MVTAVVLYTKGADAMACTPMTPGQVKPISHILTDSIPTARLSREIVEELARTGALRPKMAEMWESILANGEPVYHTQPTYQAWTSLKGGVYDYETSDPSIFSFLGETWGDERRTASTMPVEIRIARLDASYPHSVRQLKAQGRRRAKIGEFLGFLDMYPDAARVLGNLSTHYLWPYKDRPPSLITLTWDTESRNLRWVLTPVSEHVLHVKYFTVLTVEDHQS